MKKSKHLDDDNKDIMMGNTTCKWQWNGQFYKSSGRHVLLKHDNLLNEIPNTLVTIFFPCSTTMNSVLSFGTKIKGRECHPAARCQSLVLSVPKWGGWRSSLLVCRIWRRTSQKMEGPHWQILSTGLMVRFSLCHLKRLEMAVAGLSEGKKQFSSCGR